MTRVKLGRFRREPLLRLLGMGYASARAIEQSRAAKDAGRWLFS